LDEALGNEKRKWSRLGFGYILEGSSSSSSLVLVLWGGGESGAGWRGKKSAKSNNLVPGAHKIRVEREKG